MTRIKAILITTIFFVLIGSAYIVWPIAKNFVDTENHEKRELASKPALTWTGLRDFPQDYENYVNDNLPFRNQLIKTEKHVESATVSLQSTEKVLVGKDGWLYYIDSADGDPVASYKGRDVLTEEQLAGIKSNVEETAKNMKAEGRTFVIMIVPNKERMYPEYLPDSAGDPAEIYAAKQIYDYLKANTDVHIVYPYDALMQAKVNLGENTLLYYKTDSDWNELGAYIATCEMFKEIADEVPCDLPDYMSSQITIEQQEAPTGDLAEMLNAVGVVKNGPTFVPTGLNAHQLQSIVTNFSGESQFNTSDGYSNLTVYAKHDSFGDNMAPYLACQFAYTAMVHHSIGNNDYIRVVNPDVFVLECSERYAYSELSQWYYNAAQ